MNNVTNKNTRKKRKHWQAEVHLTPKIWQLPIHILDAVMLEMRKLDCFSPHKGNKLQDTHGSLEVEGYKIFWRLEHLHNEYECLSPQPSSRKATARVLSVGLASELTPLIPRPQPTPKL